jgi:hypothetical protein
MKHPITRAALVAAVIGLVGTPLAVSAQQPAPPAAFAGSYTLAQVDDAELPVLIGESATCKGEITAATLALQPEGKYRLEASIRETCGETVKEKTFVEQGSYAAAAAGVEFTAEEQPVDPAQEKVEVEIQKLATASLEENTLKVKLKDDKTLVFRK